MAILLVVFDGHDTAGIGFIDSQTKTSIGKKSHGGINPLLGCMKRIGTNIEIELGIASI
jgi:hypothetical protein